MNSNTGDFNFLFGAPQVKLKKVKTTHQPASDPTKKKTSSHSLPATKPPRSTPSPTEDNQDGIDLFISTKPKKQRTNMQNTNDDESSSLPLLPPPASKKATTTTTLTPKQTINSRLSDDEGGDDNFLQLASICESTPTDTTTTSQTLINPTSAPSQSKSFSQLGVSSWIISALSKLKIIVPTDIQLKSIPAILRGENIIARAKTGSGKTAAFALPILETLSRDPYGIYALVLTPTRELALQIKDQFDIFGSRIGLSSLCVIGGVDMVKQAQALENRPHVVIATPGRLSDLLIRGSVSNFGAKHLKYLVLDEADRLFDECFTPFIDTILDYIPALHERQTILVSATLTNELINSLDQHPLFPRLITKDSVYYQSAQDDDNIVDKLTQSFLFFPHAVKECYINYLLRFANPSASNDENGADDVDHDHKTNLFKKRRHDGQVKGSSSATSPAAHGTTAIPQSQHPTSHHQSCIVFTKTVRTAQFLSLFLTEMGVKNVPLHSKVKQAQRIANLNRFRSGKVPVLIATDIAARGLDIPQVTLVINYDLPHSHQDYIHRVGRTARANRHGIALTLITQFDVNKLQELEEEVGVKLTEFGGVIEGNVIANLKIVNEKKKYAHVLIEEMEGAADGKRVG